MNSGDDALWLDGTDSTHNSDIRSDQRKHVPPPLVVCTPCLFTQSPCRADQESRQEDQEEGEGEVVEDRLEALQSWHGGWRER